jgi:hypothetical protein
MKRKELKNKIAKLKEEKKDILHADYKGKEAQYAEIAMSDIDYKIVALEDILDFKTRMLPYKIMLYGFIMISIGLLVWTFVLNKEL